MKVFKIALVVLALLVNFVIAEPSWADRPKLTLAPEYTEITQAYNDLLEAKKAPETSGYTAEEIERKLGQLQLQKYIIESARTWAQCRNETGKTLAVYTHKPKKSAPFQVGSLYFLGNGEITENEWNCDAIYLPTGAKVAGLTPGDTQGQELTASLAIKIVPGTQLVATTNPTTGAIEFNVPPAQIIKTGEGNLLIPDYSIAQIEAQVPNAPIED
ncbi:MAG: hypothetical protein HEQ35_29840 [Gloeotrichia echinulata IR180]|jgi:hypothetical protein|nr:hypothetical protein [Gloeotrichia echinulata DEX184]